LPKCRGSKGESQVATKKTPANLPLVYYHDRSVEDAAQILGIPRATVNTRMFYARKKLAEMVERV
jgi:DNA-directed RNA polymerase specialized sigma24 family protein